MGTTAREIMDIKFTTLTPEMSIIQAVKVFRELNAVSEHRVFGLTVINGQGQLVGMLSLYDIFLLIRPKHIHIWGEMVDIDLTGMLDAACKRIRDVQVGDIMTTDLITITADTHLLAIIDIMIKKHVRRIPVLENGHLLGIVYISQVFNHLLEHLLMDPNILEGFIS